MTVYRLLDESSYNLTSHEALTIKPLTRWVQQVCDTPDSLHDKNRYLEHVFHKNNYSTDFIWWNIHRPTEADAINRNPTPVTTLTISYINLGTSETISRNLSPTTSNYNYNLQLHCNTYWPMLKTGMNPKTDREQFTRSNKCSYCQASYIGETGRNLNMRLTGHKRETRNVDANNHIAVHHQLTNHNMDWDSAQCLTYSTNYFH